MGAWDHAGGFSLEASVRVDRIAILRISLGSAAPNPQSQLHARARAGRGGVRGIPHQGADARRHAAYRRGAPAGVAQPEKKPLPWRAKAFSVAVGQGGALCAGFALGNFRHGGAH